MSSPKCAQVSGRVRALAAGLLSALWVFIVLHASGCGTDAVGVDECRDIEFARCEAAQYCGLVDDVDACKRFYRDHCLHGLANGKRPGAPLIKECTTTIKRAGACAKEGIEELALCPEPPVSTKTVHATPCDIIKEPEGAAECDFLFKPVELPEAGPDVEDAGSDAAASDGATE